MDAERSDADSSPDRPFRPVGMPPSLLLVCIASTAGVWILRSCETLVSGTALTDYLTEDEGMLSLVKEQLTMLAVWVPVFWALEWRWRDIGRAFSRTDLIHVAGLYWLTYALSVGTRAIVDLPASAAYGSLSVGVFALVCVVNPVTEELIYAVIGRCCVGTSMILAVVLPAGIRSAVHLYQGWEYVLADHVPFALIAAAYYLRFRSVWTLILVHAIYNVNDLGAAL